MNHSGRPKVLQLITHLEPGGAQETVALLGEGLQERGIDVTVGTHLGGTMQRRLERAGVPLEQIPHMTREVSPVHDALAFRELEHLIRDGGFDVVHSHSSKAGVLGRLAARRAKVPVIVHTSHGLPINPDMTRLEREVLLAAERLASRASDRIVAVSHATADELLELRLARKEQLVVISSGIDVERLRNGPPRAEARRSLGLPPDVSVVGWVGRHFPQKRPDLVLRVARLVVRDVPEASFMLVGDGPSFDDAVASSADEPRIQVIGFRDDIETVYAAMDVFLLASAWEGLPRTVLEAGAAGVPVVSTDVSGVGEIVRDGETGRLVATDSEADLADAVVGLLRDHESRRTMGRAISTVTGSEYSAAHTVDACVALYSDVMSTGRRELGRRTE